MLNMTAISDLNMLIIMWILLGRCIYDRKLQREEMRYYTPMVISDIGLLTSHLILVYLLMLGYPQNGACIQVMNIIEILIHGFYYALLYFFVNYALAYVRQRKYVTKWCEYIVAAIGALYTVLWAVNSVNHMFGTFTDQGWITGPYYIFSQIGGCSILIIFVAVMIYGFKAIGAKAFFILLSFILLPVAQSIGRHFFPLPHSLVESLSLSLLIIHSFIQVEQVRYFSNIASVLEMSKRNISILEQNVNSFRKERHDMRFHMAALSGMLENDDIEGAKEYLDRYTNSLSCKIGLYCENVPLNAVLSFYTEKCELEHIPVDMVIDLDKELIIDEIDFCVLVGNLFENAYEASLNNLDKAHIEIRIKQTTDHIIALRISNYYDGDLKKEGNRFLSTKRQDGGIGLDSVREIASKYNAQMDIQTEDHVFEVKMILTD